MTNVATYSISKRQFFLFATIGFVLAVVNVLLMQQNRTLKAVYSNSPQQLEVQPGTALPPIDGADINGDKVTIGYGEDNRKTLLLVFSPRCGACKENMPNWKSLVNKLDKDSYRFIVASLVPNKVKEYLDQSGLNGLPVLAEIDPADRVSYSLALTPQTLLIDSNGQVERVWTGILSGEKKADVERVLNVRLNGEE